MANTLTLWLHPGVTVDWRKVTTLVIPGKLDDPELHTTLREAQSRGVEIKPDNSEAEQFLISFGAMVPA